MTTTITHVPAATHHYVCEQGHQVGAPFRLERCPFAACATTLTPVGPGSRSYNRSEQR